MLKSIAALLALAAALLFPHNAFAQATASIAGTVVDASGAVLPGVTVEASSPALIEKTRSVVTDGTGQFRIEQLRGGTYTVVFTLPGFSTVRREGVELTGSFAATINAELKLGSVEETITVTGDTPIVDIQSAQRQRVIDQELLNAIPTGRTPQVAAFMIPGVNLSNVDVGGTNIINTTGGALSIHGGGVGDTRLLIDDHDRQHRRHWMVGQRVAEHGQHAGSVCGLLVGHRGEHHGQPSTPRRCRSTLQAPTPMPRGPRPCFASRGLPMPKSPRIAVALKPDHEAAQYALGTALMRTERTEEGLSVLAEFERLQIAVRARTDAAWQIKLLTEQAREHAARQEYAAAADVLRRAMAYAPAEGSIRLAAGAFLVRAAKYEEAIPLLKEALAREATEAHRYLADAYDALGRNEESRAQREAYKAVAATRARQGVPIP
jgi:hypothetical protein